MLDFLECIIISLPKHAERREGVIKECVRVGLTNVTFFDAVDGAKDPDELKKTLVQTGLLSNDAVLSPGQLGCMASHMTVWTSLLKNTSSEKWTLIMEDDVRFHPEVTAEWLKDVFTDKCPTDAQFLRLAFLANGPFQKNVSTTTVINGAWHPLTGQVFSLLCYAVRLNAMSALLSYERLLPVDCQLPTGPGCYGAKRFDSAPEFYIYKNPVYNITESFYGVANVPPDCESTTAPPKLKTLTNE